MNNQFSENLKKIRKEHNLSQEQLAEELGVSRQAISKWESSIAYPEMDKIIALCEKFNLNIDDLLHKDIKEVKGEEESKKKINNYIDDFLKFITDSINLFSNMNFKDKIKCLLEQFIIIFILFIASHIFISIITSLFTGIFSFIPNNIFNIIKNILNSIIGIICIIISIIVLIHIFKTRYLDYYNKIKQDTNKGKEQDNNDKISLKNNEEKIIIRDPKHSEYKFLNGLFKFIIICIKIFLIWIALLIALSIIFLFGSLIASFLVINTGSFFIGLILAILSSSIIAINILLLILNFIFNRKSNKKNIIWSIIIAIIAFGIGCGLIFTGTLNFEVYDNNESTLKTVVKEHEMNNNLIIYPHGNQNINYIESDINNIKIEYSLNKYCDIDEQIGKEDNDINAWVTCKQPTKLAKEFIKNLNHKKIIPITGNIEKITVYAKKENIEIIKNNLNIYYEERKTKDELIKSYEEKIGNLNNENEKLKEEVNDLKDEIEDIKENN